MIVLVGLATPWVTQPSTLRLAYAMAELGPISGWRCAQNASYVYDPRRERADSTLLADAPEASVPGVEVERVEASLRGGDTVLWTRVSGPDASEQRVYVLSPGRFETVALDSPDHTPSPICTSHLGSWEIIGEHGIK